MKGYCFQNQHQQHLASRETRCFGSGNSGGGSSHIRTTTKTISTSWLCRPPPLSNPLQGSRSSMTALLQRPSSSTSTTRLYAGTSTIPCVVDPDPNAAFAMFASSDLGSAVLPQQHQFVSTSLTTAISDYSATATATTSSTFEPVLSIPALIVFLLIGSIFAALQMRVMAIEAAVVQRTEALRVLRSKKTQSLSDPVAVPYEAVQDALEAYRQAYDAVEDLRTVIPGVARIVPPPSQSMSRRIMDENEQAALQFLGIQPTVPPTSSSSNRGGASSKDAKDTDGKLTSPLLIAILLVVGLSQLALLSLLTLSDPMAGVDSVNVNVMAPDVNALSAVGSFLSTGGGLE